ncbi:hypothetical protein COL93_18515 [Bacillus toyonensis]|uniref:Uncharacterized protein n=1 Tax=Bacillus toyonensis TaxID=155322 RepID=A0A2C4R805_9BACI|nr:hypothetical protein COL93_18515 [Bacillus toyonensis]PHD72891.1 hypothetical protein COF40_04650 [Bacillus toyonensis]
MNVSNSTVPHMFSYEQYRGDMYLEDYTGVLIGLRTIYQIFAKPKKLLPYYLFSFFGTSRSFHMSPIELIHQY